MLYVQRDGDGQVVRVESEPFDAMTGSAGPEDESVQRWLAQQEQVRSRLARLQRSDLEMVRVLEDLVDVLVTRGVIRYTDLPEPAQRKLEARAQTRAQLSGLGELLGDEDEPSILF